MAASSRNLLANPFNCNCQLAWLGDWLRRRKIVTGNPRCQNPDFLRQIPLQDVAFPDFRCEEGEPGPWGGRGEAGSSALERRAPVGRGKALVLGWSRETPSSSCTCPCLAAASCNFKNNNLLFKKWESLDKRRKRYLLFHPLEKQHSSHVSIFFSISVPNAGRDLPPGHAQRSRLTRGSGTFPGPHPPCGKPCHFSHPGLLHAIPSLFPEAPPFFPCTCRM